MKVNAGLGLKLPYESPYCKWRRFISANPLLRDKDLKSLIRSMDKGYDAPILKNENLLKLANHYDDSPDFFESVFTDTDHLSKPIKSCPICSEYGYHSILFQFDWLLKCPIHGIELIKSCPTCEKPWPMPADVRSRRCKTCGKINIRKSPSGIPEFRDQINEKLGALAKTLSENPLQHIHFFSTRSPYGYTHKNMPPEDITYFDHHRLRVQDKLPDSVNDSIYKSEVGLSVERYDLSEEIHRKRWMHCNTESRERRHLTAKCKMSLLREITNSIEDRLGHEHNVQLYNPFRSASFDPETFEPTCLYCFAFSAWFHLVSAFPFHTNRLTNQYFWFFNHEPFNQYTPPVPMDMVIFKDKQYWLDVDFQEYMYTRDLRRSFLNLVYDIKKHYRDKDCKPETTENRFQHHLSPPLYCWINGHSLYVAQPQNEDLSGDMLPLRKCGKSSCLKAEIDDEIKLSRPATYKIIQALSTEDLLTLQNGLGYEMTRQY